MLAKPFWMRSCHPKSCPGFLKVKKSTIQKRRKGTIDSNKDLFNSYKNLNSMVCLQNYAKVALLEHSANWGVAGNVAREVSRAWILKSLVGSMSYYI